MAPSHLPYLFHRWERPLVFLLWISVVILQIVYVEVIENDNKKNGLRHNRVFQRKRDPQDATQNAIPGSQDPAATSPPDQNAQSDGENIFVRIYDHVTWRSEALSLAISYCQMDFDIGGGDWSGILFEWIEYYRRPSRYRDVPLHAFPGNSSIETVGPFEGKLPWIEDLAAAKFVYNSSYLFYTLEWETSDGSEFKVVDCGSHQDNCSSTFYQSTDNVSQYFIPVENTYYVDPDIFTTVTELQYASRTNDGYSSLVDVHCCPSDGGDRSIISRIVDHDESMTRHRLCLESACPPYDPSKLLVEVWKATLRGIIAEAATACRSFISEIEADGRIVHMSDDSIYNESLIHRFYSDGLATQIAVDLWEFHHSREESDSDVFLEVGIMTSVYNPFSKIPNHHWSLEEFLTIIMDTTSAFRPESVEDGNLPISDPCPDGMYDAECLGRAIVESLTDKLDSMRSPGWQKKEFGYPLQVYNLTTMENYELIRGYIFPRDSVSLLPGSQCGNVLDALDIVLPSLLVSLDEWEYDTQREYDTQQQDFLVMVGNLVIGLLLMQLTLRCQRLPGGCLMKRDLKRSIDRNRQVRMALEDEYLCRERECRAIAQLGEDAAREALGLLTASARREPGLPHDYQMRQRKHSRWFVMGGHFVVVLLIAIRDWDVFLWFEVALMLINVMQSVAEVRAMRLLAKQDDDSKRVADDDDDVEDAEHDEQESDARDMEPVGLDKEVSDSRGEPHHDEDEAKKESTQVELEEGSDPILSN